MFALGGMFATAGCLGRDGGTDVTRTGTPSGNDTTTPSTDSADGGGGSTATAPSQRYVECPREIIPYDRFPARIRAEIDAARGGRYEATEVHLRDVMDVTESYVAIDEAFYDPAVTTDAGEEVLTLQRVEPKALPNPRPVTVEHRIDGERVVTVEVVADDGTTLVDTTMDLWPGGDVAFGRVARVGTHAFRIVVADGDRVEMETTEEVRVVPSLASVHLVIDSETVEVRQAVTDAPSCRFTA